MENMKKFGWICEHCGEEYITLECECLSESRMNGEWVRTSEGAWWCGYTSTGYYLEKEEV